MEKQGYELNKQALGNFLSQLRKEKGWTQKDLAEKLYVSDKAVSKWERGLSVPDVSLLMPLSELLGVSVTELLVLFIYLGGLFIPMAVTARRYEFGKPVKKKK